MLILILKSWLAAPREMPLKQPWVRVIANAHFGFTGAHTRNNTVS